MIWISFFFRICKTLTKLMSSIPQFPTSASPSPIHLSIFIFLFAISVYLFSAASWWSAAFIISKCHLDISSWGQEGCCKWGVMEEGGHREGHEMRNTVKSSSWPLRDSKIWLRLQARNREDRCRRMQIKSVSHGSLCFSLSQSQGEKAPEKDKAAECHNLDIENWERPDELSSVYGKPDLLKGQSVISEKSHFSPLRKLNVICVITGPICNLCTTSIRPWRHVSLPSIGQRQNCRTGQYCCGWVSLTVTVILCVSGLIHLCHHLRLRRRWRTRETSWFFLGLGIRPCPRLWQQK